MANRRMGKLQDNIQDEIVKDLLNEAYMVKDILGVYDADGKVEKKNATNVRNETIGYFNRVVKERVDQFCSEQKVSECLNDLKQLTLEKAATATSANGNAASTFDKEVDPKVYSFPFRLPVMTKYKKALEKARDQLQREFTESIGKSRKLKAALEKKLEWDEDTSTNQ